MRISADVDSLLKRATMVGGGVLALSAVVVVALAFLWPWREDAPPETVPRRKPREARAEEPRQANADIPAASVTSSLRTAPPRPSNEAQVARALDQSNTRELVRILMEAAARGNSGLKASMLGALARAGTSPRPILEAEMKQAQNPAVRRALEEAMERCQ